jgi:hypothetical protein
MATSRLSSYRRGFALEIPAVSGAQDMTIHRVCGPQGNDQVQG